MLNTLFKFQIKPTSTTDEIIKFDKNRKVFIPIAIIILHFIVSQISLYFMMPELFKMMSSPIGIVKSLILSFVGFYLFNAGIKLFGQILGGKSTFEDINLVTAYSMFIYVIINLVVSILGKVLGLGILASFGIFIPFIWFLVVYSKSLSKVQQFSESKVLVNVIVVAVIFYYLNKVITASLGAGMF